MMPRLIVWTFALFLYGRAAYWFYLYFKPGYPERWIALGAGFTLILLPPLTRFWRRERRIQLTAVAALSVLVFLDFEIAFYFNELKEMSQPRLSVVPWGKGCAPSDLDPLMRSADLRPVIHDGLVGGWVFRSIEENSAWREYGFLPRDIIRLVSGESAKTLEDLRGLLARDFCTPRFIIEFQRNFTPFTVRRE